MSARKCLYVRKVIFCVFIMKMYLFHIYLCFSFHSKATSAGTRWWHQRDSCTPGTTSQPTSSLPPSLRKWWGPTCVKSYWVPKSKIWCVWFLISNVEWSSTHKNITFWKITFHTSIFHELQLLYYFLFIDLQFWNELIKIYCVLSCVISFMLWNTPDDKAYFFFYRYFIWTS